MTAYRFCRTDDMGLLVAAYESCRGPEDAGAPELDLSGFKQLVRELDLWCSSSMVALEGREPVGVLLGAKRPTTTLIYGLRVHPRHRRRGHGRHLLTSLSQKLAILGPPKLLAEVPAERSAACALFAACGWRLESGLRDWRRDGASPSARASEARDAVAPVTFQDLSAAGLLAIPRDGAGPFGAGARCWQRDLAALVKRGERISGLAFHSTDGIEAWVLYEPGADHGAGRGDAWQVLAVGFVPGPLGRLGLEVVMDELGRLVGGAPLLLSRVAPDELDGELLAELGFEPRAEHLLYATEAQAA